MFESQYVSPPHTECDVHRVGAGLVGGCVGGVGDGVGGEVGGEVGGGVGQPRQRSILPLAVQDDEHASAWSIPDA